MFYFLFFIFYYYGKWCPHQELNLDQLLRRQLLYPFELWGRYN